MDECSPAPGTAAVPAPGTGPAAGRWRRFGWLFAAVWLVFLVAPFHEALVDRRRPTGALALVALVLFAVVYLHTWVIRRRRHDAFSWAAVLPARQARTKLVVLVALVALTLPGLGLDGAGALVFVCCYAVFAMAVRTALVVAGSVVLACAAAGLAVPGWSGLLSVAAAAALASLAVFGVTGTARRGQLLALAQQDLARLAVAEERSRFSRDLHDLLGHSLTVVTLKAELAGRLLEAGTPQASSRAAAEVADIERLARDALQDVRAALEGHREVSLGSELAGARQALAAAGIAAELPGAVDDVPEAARELFGWVVREGVTNVIRHSGARRCWVELSPGSVAVCDDGRGPAAGARGSGSLGSGSLGPGPLGSGLRGLADRAAAAGAVLAVERSAAGGFSVLVRMAAGPAGSAGPARSAGPAGAASPVSA